MKKLVIVLFVFCSVLFVTNPILKSSFANNDSKPSNGVTKIEKPLVKETDNNKTLETNTVSDIDDSDSNKDITAKEISKHTNKINSDLESKKEVPNVTVSNDQKVTNPSETNKKDDVVKSDDSNNSVESNNSQDVVNPNDSNKDIENDKSNVAKALSRNDALNLLLDMNPNLVYAYQGDENTFPVLKSKGLSGYVFLPNVDTDLGYFVDKNTSSIYYFHPSGYLEKIR